MSRPSAALVAREVRGARDDNSSASSSGPQSDEVIGLHDGLFTCLSQIGCRERR